MPRVLVAMSGGVDSATSAVILHRQGYEVIGVTMKVWNYEAGNGAKKTSGCCNLEDFNDARKVALQEGFPHYILDLSTTFQEGVIENFVQTYLAGKTPNPCILCNTLIKWDALLEKAKELRCDYIATGHYAQIRKEGNRYILYAGADRRKDQSYVLWGLRQEVLARTLFPLGALQKSGTRDMAAELGLGDIAKKKDSYEICFIPDNDYRAFLRARAPHALETLPAGVFKNKEGKIIGSHEGYPFFTLGQRRKLGIALGQPAYVVGIEKKTNTVRIGNESELMKNTLFVRDVNWIKKIAPWDTPLSIKVRYRDPGTQGILQPTEYENIIQINFPKGVKNPAPGQSAVFYEGEDVIGGGFIESIF